MGVEIYHVVADITDISTSPHYLIDDNSLRRITTTFKSLVNVFPINLIQTIRICNHDLYMFHSNDLKSMMALMAMLLHTLQLT